MNRFGLALVLGLTLAIGCGDDDDVTDDTGVDASTPQDLGDPGTDQGPPAEDDMFAAAEDMGSANDPDMGDPDMAVGGTLETFEQDVAAAKCAAIFRCCDEASRVEFFDQYSCFGGLACAYEDQQEALPPATEAECVTVMLELDEVTFGGWLTEARAGNVGFDETAQEACLDELATATCGEDLEAALHDGACFARSGTSAFGDVMTVDRVMFERTAGVDDACVTFWEEPYGTCDPEVAFCCGGSGADCTTGGPGGESGTCVAVATEGETCSSSGGPLCAPGLACENTSGEIYTCVVPMEPTPLANGETCLSESFESLGECTDGYCDNDTRQCTAAKANGEDCFQDAECVSGNCEVSGTPPIVDRACADPTFCVGT